jgi:hypothetical protein
MRDFILYKRIDFIDGGPQWCSANGEKPPTADLDFGEPPYETEDYGYENSPEGEGRGAGNDGSSVIGDVDKKRINHSQN